VFVPLGPYEGGARRAMHTRNAGCLGGSPQSISAAGNFCLVVSKLRVSRSATVKEKPE